MSKPSPESVALASQILALIGKREIGEAIDAAVEMIERMERDLRLIAETGPVDAALDPQRAIRVARAALEELK